MHQLLPSLDKKWLVGLTKEQDGVLPFRDFDGKFILLSFEFCSGLVSGVCLGASCAFAVDGFRNVGAGINVNLEEIFINLLKCRCFEIVQLPEMNDLKVRQMRLLLLLEIIDEELMRQNTDEHHLEVEEGVHVFLLGHPTGCVVLNDFIGAPESV